MLTPQGRDRKCSRIEKSKSLARWQVGRAGAAGGQVSMSACRRGSEGAGKQGSRGQGHTLNGLHTRQDDGVLAALGLKRTCHQQLAVAAAAHWQPGAAEQLPEEGEVPLEGSIVLGPTILGTDSVLAHQPVHSCSPETACCMAEYTSADLSLSL